MTTPTHADLWRMAYEEGRALAIRLRAAAAGHTAPDPSGEWYVGLAVSRRTARRYDLDNVVKAVMDSANGIIWQDDSQVASIVADRLPRGGDHGDRLAVEFVPLVGGGEP